MRSDDLLWFMVFVSWVIVAILFVTSPSKSDSINQHPIYSQHTGIDVKGPVCWRIKNPKYKYQALCPSSSQLTSIPRRRHEDVIVKKPKKDEYDSPRI